jgi:hypothetical protein
MAEASCENCGEPTVEGRMNCPQCGTVYPDAGERELERNPGKQGDAGTT